MLPTFVIGLREGVEAALIVGIIAAFLVKEGHRDALRPMWIGVLAAVLLCLSVGIALQILDQELPQKQQEGLEATVAFVAVGMVTWMIVWMRRNAAGLAGELRSSAASALARGSVMALVAMAFFAVLREGLETAVFLLAAFQNASNPTTAGLGVVLGLAAAVVIGVMLYRGGTKLNLQRFFRLTAIVLVLVAAGLVSNGLHSAHEAGWINFGQEQAFDLSWLVVPGTWTSSLLTGMLGLQPRPVVAEVVGYLVYAVPMLLFVLWPQKRPSRKRSAAGRATVAGATLAALVLLLAACGSDSSGGSGKNVKVNLTDAGCDPSKLNLDAGPTTFDVTNSGTTKISEFEILDGKRILGEKENIVGGLSGSFSVTLQPGTYTISCPGGTSAATGDLVVKGRAASPSKGDRELTAAVVGYRSYVESQSRLLLKRVTPFVAAVKAGDVARAKQLFSTAREPYERIEPVAESFGDLDPKLDARVNDVAKGAEWTGFHRIEQALWVKNSAKGMGPFADQLLVDTKDLVEKSKGLTFQPDQIANGANGLLDEVSASKITGEEDRYSHTDLVDFEANLQGAQTTFGLLAPALRKRDPALAKTIAARFVAVQAELDTLKQNGKFPSYETVGKAQRRKLSQLVDSLAEPLSKVAAKLQQ